MNENMKKYIPESIKSKTILFMKYLYCINLLFNLRKKEVNYCYKPGDMRYHMKIAYSSL